MVFLFCRLRRAGNEQALLAFDVYAHRLVRELGAMLAVLPGLVLGAAVGLVRQLFRSGATV